MSLFAAIIFPAFLFEDQDLLAFALADDYGLFLSKIDDCGQLQSAGSRIKKNIRYVLKGLGNFLCVA